MARARQNHIIEGRGAKRLEKGRVARVPGSAAIKNSQADVLAVSRPSLCQEHLAEASLVTAKSYVCSADSDVALLAIKSALLSSACVTAFDVATR